MPLKRPALVIALTAGLSSSALGFLASAGTATQQFDNPPSRLASAVFAAGCFSCVEADFDAVEGVIETTAGYTGGSAEHPTHRQVSAGTTGHYEAVKVTYDPSQVSYHELSDYFVRHIDPTAADACGSGGEANSAIFVSGQGEREAAEETLTQARKALGGAVVTEILPSAAFWPAEAQYQDLHARNARKYAELRAACGRDQRVEALWGDAAQKS